MMQTVNTGNVLQVLSFITAMICFASWLVFAIYYRRLRRQVRRRYTMMLVWLTATAIFWLINIVLRIFYDYRSPSVPLTLFRVVIDINGYLGILIIFFLRLKSWHQME